MVEAVYGGVMLIAAAIGWLMHRIGALEAEIEALRHEIDMRCR